MGSGEMRNEMLQEKEEVKLFMELKTLEERGVGIWMEGHASDSQKVMETMSVNEDSTYMRDYIFQKGVLKAVCTVALFPFIRTKLVLEVTKELIPLRKIT